MYNRKKLIIFLKSKGYDEKSNLADFWFSMQHLPTGQELIEIGQRDGIGIQLRWETEIGLKCQESVREYIVTQQKLHLDKQNKPENRGKISFEKAIIDFRNIRFDFDGFKHDLISFQRQFDTSIITGPADLRGIDLSNIKFYNCALRNGFFPQSKLTNSNFTQVQFENMNFGSCDFTDSRLTSIQFDNQSTINNCNFSGAFLNAITLTDKIIGDNLKITKISYFDLIRKSFDSNRLKRFNSTDFLLVDTKQITDHTSFETKKYIEWYISVDKKIRQASTIKEKLSIRFQIILSKFWSSISVFGSISVFTILILSGLFMSLAENFFIKPELGTVQFIDAVYFVIVTFTTLGYGDITPSNWIGEIFIIFNVLIGYIYLGLFVFLLSKKIENN